MADPDLNPAPDKNDRPMGKEDGWNRSHSRWGLWINGTIGICTVLGFCLLMYQTRLARQEAAESEKSFLASLEQARRSADAAQAAADAAQKSAEVAGRALQLDHRAWVGVATFAPPNLQPGSTVTFTVQLLNSGRSPALNVKAHTSYRLLSARGSFTPIYRKRKDNLRPSLVVIQPGVSMALPGSIDGPLSAADVEAVRTGKKVLYIFGRIEYTDVFRTEHHSTFCVFLTKDHESGTACSEYSEAS